MFFFCNVQNESLENFIDHITLEDMCEMTWRNFSIRLKQTATNRYLIRGREFRPSGDQSFDGVLKFLKDESNGNISEKVEITASSNQLALFRFQKQSIDSNELPNEVI